MLERMPERLAGVDEIIVDWPQGVLASMLGATPPLRVISLLRHGGSIQNLAR